MIYKEISISRKEVEILVLNKSEMISKFDEILYKNYERFKAEEKNETNQIKSYILENHLFAEDINRYDSIIGYLKEWVLKLTSSSPKKAEWDLRINETHDEHLVSISTIFGEIYLDITNPRFWIMNSAVKAKQSDMIFRNILKEESMDNIWLPSTFINDLDKYGKLYGLGVSYTELLKQESPYAEIDSYFENDDKLTLNIKKLNTTKMLNVLQQSDFKENIAISKISLLKYEENLAGGQSDFIVDDITYFGKFTAKGTSYAKHSHLVNSIFNEYGEKVKDLEKNFAFQYLDLEDENNSIEGRVLNLIFGRKNIDIVRLVDLLVSGSKPFRLWGIPSWESKSRCLVRVLDLHNGNFAKSMDLDITPADIKIILPKGACGNTLARLVTNIHQNIDATAQLVGEGDSYDFFRIRS